MLEHSADTEKVTNRNPGKAPPSKSDRLRLVKVVEVVEQGAEYVAGNDAGRSDELTGLLKRTAFIEAAHVHVESKQAAALLLFDLDAFADINDVLGHTTGDLLLTAVAERLRRNVRRDHLLARISGDRFALLLPGMNEPRSTYQRAQQLLEILREEFCINRQSLLLDSSAGIAVAPHHGATVEALLTSAELSLYQAKEKGGGVVGFYEPHLRRQAEAKRMLQGELRRAFEQQEFELLYQPQVELRSRRIVGAEALLRWNHPRRGQLGPGCFLAVLDQMPLAEAVGNWVIDRAIAQGAAWARQGLSLRVGANLFAAQLRSDGLADFVASRLRFHDLAPQMLELELTETVAIKDRDMVTSTLRTLRQSGVSIALDDFGTGYASLSMLKELPISRLKIDKSFVVDLAQGSHDAVLVDAILRLGSTFGLAVIAEGIERAEQERWLIAQQCIEGQGFMYGRPMTAAQLAKSALGE